MLCLLLYLNPNISVLGPHSHLYRRFVYGPDSRRAAFPHPTLRVCRGRATWIWRLLALAGDVELNPGPCTRYPCGVCGRAVRWKDRAVACDSCDTWYHVRCMAMNTQTYEALACSDFTWTCVPCGLPNFSSRLFNSFPDPNLSDSNPFIPLSTSDNLENSKSPTFNPQNHSTPKKKQRNFRRGKPNKIRNLKCLIANFQSLFNKKEELSNLIKIQDFDIILGTETWLTPEIRSSELLLDQFDIFRRDRDGKRGGGVVICCKKDLSAVGIKTGVDNESIFCKIEDKNKSIVIGSIYRPPGPDQETCSAICKDISDICLGNKNSAIWVGGDFNLPDINWSQETITGKHLPLTVNQRFLDTFRDAGLTQIIQSPSRGTAFLDLFFSNAPDLITNQQRLPGLGDHDFFSIEGNLNPTRKKPPKRRVHLWKKADCNSMARDALEFQKLFLTAYSANSDVNTMWNSIKENLNYLLDKHVPSKMTSSRFHQPWITTRTKRLLKRKHRLFKNSRECQSKRLINKYKEIKQLCQKECRRAHFDYVNSIFSEGNLQNKKLWSYIKSKRQESNNIPDLTNDHGNLAQDPLGKANLLNEQFSSVFSNPSPAIDTTLSQQTRLPDIQEILVSSEGVHKLLSNINVNKATGPDGIPGRILKICAMEYADIYRLLFQASLDQGIIPDDWRDANVVPLFKKGDRSKPSNYRPVSLTSISSKLLEHIVYSNMMAHFDNHSLLNNAQHGFRKRRSCETQLISTVNDFADCLHSKGQIDAILLDFSKAFDKVDHFGLLDKLEHYGIRNSLLSWINSFLSNRRQSVVVEGTSSSPMPVISGVPQGTVLGPLLFLVYINDISEDLTEGTEIRLFADDSLLYRKIESKSDCIILQNDLNTLQKWEAKWKMEFHPQKCQHLRITNKQKPLDHTYHIHGINLNLTPSARYLGVVIDSGLKWKDHHIATLKKANNVLAFIKRNLKNCPTNIRSNCYKTLVRPILEYGSVVWDPHHQNIIDQYEKIQKRAARFATGNHQMEHGNTVKNMMFLDWKPLEERRAANRLTMFFRAKRGLVEIPFKHLKLAPAQDRRPGTYAIPSSSVDSHLYSFYPNTIRLWNSLPLEVRETGSVDSFKTYLDKITVKSTYRLNKA